MANTALNLDAIQALLGSARTRGDYGTVLSDFIKSGEQGIEVDLSEGLLAGKDYKNVVTGFKNAQGKMNKETGKPEIEGAHLVKVIGRSVKKEDGTEEGHVFLINTAALSGNDSTTTDQSEPAAE